MLTTGFGTAVGVVVVVVDDAACGGGPVGILAALGMILWFSLQALNVNRICQQWLLCHWIILMYIKKILAT